MSRRRTLPDLKSLSLAVFFILLATVCPSVQASPVDPDILPPEVTIPLAVPPNSLPPPQTQAPNNPSQTQGMPTGTNNQPVMTRRGIPIDPSGVIGGHSTAPGQAPTAPGQGQPGQGQGAPAQSNNVFYFNASGANQPGASAAATGSGDAGPPLTGKECFGCESHKAIQSTAGMMGIPNPNGQPLPPPTSAAPSHDPIAVIQTSKGNITVRLFKDLAPNTVANFLDLTQRGFYNNLVWHRVVPGFCIQTGCPKGDGTGAFVDPTVGKERRVMLELNPRLRHNAAGVLAMARFGNDPNSASSQFYITLSAQPHLDNKYTIFGGVISGMDVVNHIAVGDRVLSVSLQQQ